MASSGIKTWYQLPVRILGGNTNLATLLDNEKQVITWLHPKLNALVKGYTHQRLLKMNTKHPTGAKTKSKSNFAKEKKMRTYANTQATHA